jgi:hypothetical protein
LRNCDFGVDNFTRKKFGDAPIVDNFESAKVSCDAVRGVGDEKGTL